MYQKQINNSRTQKGLYVLQAIRGAITAAANEATEILQQTTVLLRELLKANGLQAQEVISIIFTATPDLNAAFPAAAARALGLTEVALLDAVEIDVPGALAKTIRVLMLVDRPHSPRDVHHVYLGEAKRLRPDWAAR